LGNFAKSQSPPGLTNAASAVLGISGFTAEGGAGAAGPLDFGVALAAEVDADFFSGAGLPGAGLVAFATAFASERGFITQFAKEVIAIANTSNTTAPIASFGIMRASLSASNGEGAEFTVSGLMPNVTAGAAGPSGRTASAGTVMGLEQFGQRTACPRRCLGARKAPPQEHVT
jgi:hypothetical protein